MQWCFSRGGVTLRLTRRRMQHDKGTLGHNLGVEKYPAILCEHQRVANHIPRWPRWPLAQTLSAHDRSSDGALLRSTAPSFRAAPSFHLPFFRSLSLAPPVALKAAIHFCGQAALLGVLGLPFRERVMVGIALQHSTWRGRLRDQAEQTCCIAKVGHQQWNCVLVPCWRRGKCLRCTFFNGGNPSVVWSTYYIMYTHLLAGFFLTPECSTLTWKQLWLCR